MNEIYMRDAIAAVGETFIVICGVAISQFFSGDGTVVDTDPAFRIDKQTPPKRDTWYVICYVLALIILVTLILRLVIGSHTQLTDEYGRPVDYPSFRRFIADVSFLMFFGAFLVGAAQSKSVRGFMGWLALNSAAGFLWSAIALRRVHSPLVFWWLEVNLAQFVLTLILNRWCKPVDAGAGKGKTAATWGLVVAGVWFMLMFVFDLEKIIRR
jgi:hypothetical protein